MADPSTIIVTLKAAAGVAQKAGNIPLQSQILDLQQTLFDLMATQAALFEEREALKGQVEELERRLRLHDDFEHFHNAYWKKEGNSFTGPFCATCFDADAKAIRLILQGAAAGLCGVCKNRVVIAEPGRNDHASQRRTEGPGFVRSWKR